MKRTLRAALAAAFLAAAPASAQVATPNYQDTFGWHVGGVLEVLTGGKLRLDTGTKTATASAGAATLNKLSGVVTTEALTTAAGATYTLTLTNSAATANDLPFVSIAPGTSTAGMPAVQTVTASAGQLKVVVRNNDASAALNGTLKITFALIKN